MSYASTVTCLAFGSSGALQYNQYCYECQYPCDTCNSNGSCASDGCEQIICDNGYQLNSTGDGCEQIICGNGYQLNSTGDGCEQIICGNGYQINSTGDGCEKISCNQGYELDGEYNCIKIECRYGYQVSSYNKCELIKCQQGFQLNDLFQCIEIEKEKKAIEDEQKQQNTDNGIKSTTQAIGTTSSIVASSLIPLSFSGNLSDQELKNIQYQVIIYSSVTILVMHLLLVGFTILEPMINYIKHLIVKTKGIRDKYNRRQPILNSERFLDTLKELNQRIKNQNTKLINFKIYPTKDESQEKEILKINSDVTSFRSYQPSSRNDLPYKIEAPQKIKIQQNFDLLQQESSQNQQNQPNLSKQYVAKVQSQEEYQSMNQDNYLSKVNNNKKVLYKSMSNQKIMALQKMQVQQIINQQQNEKQLRKDYNLYKCKNLYDVGQIDNKKTQKNNFLSSSLINLKLRKDNITQIYDNKSCINNSSFNQNEFYGIDQFNSLHNLVPKLQQQDIENFRQFDMQQPLSGISSNNNSLLDLQNNFIHSPTYLQQRKTNKQTEKYQFTGFKKKFYNFDNETKSAQIKNKKQIKDSNKNLFKSYDFKQDNQLNALNNSLENKNDISQLGMQIQNNLDKQGQNYEEEYNKYVQKRKKNKKNKVQFNIPIIKIQ
ncbi:Insulin-like growth factor binding protein, N-terminal [Pseudocohnilembus persalinus]|uniref:Insulin-like growth factor binding protein, N-terminal n=1 Tax=Pseudocohnilembus persalinus TaxID=266149 RepID=A0A0V0QDE5_PSEPJ|nr:Insulin-like growth factor binding protein, N-terminal [Pseudocohnilembus persalinus]|eukprot:KRX00160.1 Insulin-like growth factor binding protein, N-terminal [Pseudocohnilembus persalinus]